MNDKVETFSRPEVQATEPSPETSNAASVNGVDVWPRVLKLKKPVMAYGNQISELKFREPTGRDIAMSGNPVLFALYEDVPKLHYDAKAMATMMSNLASVPLSTIEQLNPRDWNNGAIMLAGFFTPDL